MKRKEDQEKLKEFERNKIQLQTLLEYKHEMTQAHRVVQDENEELKRKIDDLLKQADENTDSTRLREQMELLSLDKEMAEEKVEFLQAELEALEAKNKDLENELKLMKNALEKSELGGDDGGVDNLTNSVQLKKLEQQNERYQQALLKMRDAINQLNQELQSTRKDLELAHTERDELTDFCQQLENELQEARTAIADFRDQVDAAMGSEKMISTLTDRNLDLEEKIRKMEEEINALEALRLMDDEIAESQKEIEKDLRQDLERHMFVISDLKRQLFEYDKRSKNYENVILKFRQKNAELNEEIEHLKDEILIMKDQQEAHTKKQGDDGSFSLKVVAVNRTFAEVVESELKSVQLDYAILQADYIKMFLPDNFTKQGGDFDGILLRVLFPRMADKALKLVKLLNLKFPSLPNNAIRREHITLSHKAEQWAHVRQYSYSLHKLNTILRRFESVMETCSVERLSKLAIQQMEITPQERVVDMYFELLRTNRFDENTSIDNLDRAVNFFNKIFATNMTAESGNAKEFLRNTIVQLKEGLAWNYFNCERLKYFLQPSDAESSEFADFVSRVTDLVRECESLAIRALNRIPAENDLLLSAETNEKVMCAIGAFEKTAKVIHNTCSFAASQLTTIDVDGFQSTQMKEMLHSSVEKFVGPMDSSKAYSTVNECFEELKTFLSDISDRLEKSSMEIPPVHKCSLPPLKERAHMRKQDVVEVDSLRWQISKKNDEVLELQKLVKARERDISTLNVRLDMVNRQIETSYKSGDTKTQHLQQRCDHLQEDFVRQKAEHEKKLKELNEKLAHAIEERDKERQRANGLDKNILMATPSVTLSPLHHNSSQLSGSGAGNLSGSTTSDIPSQRREFLLQKELQNTLTDLKWAERRIRLLENQNTRALLNDMKCVKPPDIVAGIYSLALRSQNVDEEKAKLAEMICESEELIQESNSCIIEPLDRRERNIFRCRVISINNRMETLKHSFLRFWSQTHPGEQLPSLTRKSAESSNLAQLKAIKNPEQRCRSILEKWNSDLKREQSAYNKLIEQH